MVLEYEILSSILVSFTLSNMWLNN